MSTLLLTIAAAAFFIACPIGWTVILLRRNRGEEPVPYEPRRPVPWSVGWVMLLVMLYLVTQAAAAIAARQMYERAHGRLPEVMEFINPALLIEVLRGHVVASAFALAASLILLHKFVGANAVDVGFTSRRWASDLRRGIGWFFIIVPPVLLLQGLLTTFVAKSQHPLIEGWRDGGDGTLLLWSFLATVIAAPLLEEFLFRGVIQGWLERLYSDADQPNAPSNSGAATYGDVQEATVDAGLGAASYDFELPHDLELNAEPSAAPSPVTSPPSWTPILISSLVFALAHWGNGPDPLPIFVLALGLGYLYRQTHRLWPGIVVHACMNGLSTAILASGVAH